MLRKSSLHSNKTGFTLIELIIVVGIMTMISMGAIVLFLSVQSNSAREVVVSEITTVLRRTQSRAMFGELQSEFGVQFFPNRYIEFLGDAYVEDDTGNTEHLLPAGVSLSSINFNGETSVYFNRITGGASDAGTVDVRVIGIGGVKRIDVNTLGTVNVQIIE